MTSADFNKMITEFEKAYDVILKGKLAASPLFQKAKDKIRSNDSRYFFKLEAVQHEQRAAREAFRIISALPEYIYEKALARYNCKKIDYYYYLIRRVIDTQEAQSQHCDKAGIVIKLVQYDDMIQVMKNTKPVIVLDERKKIDLSQMEIGFQSQKR